MRHGPYSKPGDVELELGLDQWFCEEVGHVVLGGHAADVDEAQLLLIPPEVEVLGKGARRAGETNFAGVGDDDRVFLENGDGPQIDAAGDVVAEFGRCRVPSAVGEGDHLRVVEVGRDRLPLSRMAWPSSD